MKMFGNDTVVMVAQHRECTKNHRLAHFGRENFMVCTSQVKKKHVHRTFVSPFHWFRGAVIQLLQALRGDGQN